MVESPWPFVARDNELKVFERAWSRSGCCVVAIFGQAGVGKSRLAGHLLARAAGAGFKAARVAASAAATAVPLGVMAHLIPAGIDLSDPVAGFAEIARLLAGRSGRDRWVVFVDDLHLLDGVSTTLLRHLMDTGVVRLIATVRTGGPAGVAVEALTQGDAVCRIDLKPFGRGDVERMLRTALGAPVGHRALHRLFEASGGNALDLRELVHGALEARALSNDGEIWDLAEGALPTTPRLGELIRGRLTVAPAAARGVLELLAVCEPVSLDDVVSAASVDVLAGLEEAGLIEVRQDARRTLITLSHPLYGEALREDLSVVRRRALVLEQIERTQARGGRRYDDALRLAAWRLAATGTADPALLVQAAALARHAHNYEQAIALLEALPEAYRGFESCLIHGDSLAQLGRSKPADAMLADAQSRAVTERDKVTAAMARTWNLFWMAARTKDALRVNEAARARVACLDGRRLLALNEASLLIVSGRPVPGLAALGDLEADVRDAPDANAWLAAAMSKTAGLAYVGRTAEAISWGRRAHVAHVRAGHQTLGTAHPASQLVPLIIAYADAGRLAEAAETAERVLADLVSTSSARAKAWAAVFRGRVEWLAGDMAAARRWYAEAIALSRIQHQTSSVHQAWGGLAAAAAALGDVGAAEAALVQMRAFPAMGHLAGEDHLGEAWLHAARGELSRARNGLAAAAAAARDAGQVNSEMLLLTDIARLGGAKEVTGRLAELSGRCDGAFAPARAHLSAALAADDPGPLMEAAHELEAIGAHLLAAEAATAAAAAWRRGGQVRRATAASQAGRAYGANCPGVGTPLLANAEATHALTAREREIALLAAANARSKEIAEALRLSVRTVNNHLQRAYTKLGVSTRAELAAILGQPRSARARAAGGSGEFRLGAAGTLM